ncbi:MAG: hypothetical protein WA816_13325 [Bacteroidales bacterium]
MKKVVISAFLLLFLFINSYGQWYLKKYQVTDINSLSKEQLEESLLNSKSSLLTSGIIAGSGGALFLVFKYLAPGMSDDPTIIEQILGDEGVNKVGMVTGIGILIGGSIASIAYLGRIGRINSVLRKNYPSFGSLDISPTIVLSRINRSSCPGLRLTYNF